MLLPGIDLRWLSAEVGLRQLKRDGPADAKPRPELAAVALRLPEPIAAVRHPPADDRVGGHLGWHFRHARDPPGSA